MDSVYWTVLDKYGPSALIIFVLAVVVVFQYRENKALQAENAGLRDRLLQKAEDYATKILDLSNQVLTTIAQLNDLFTKKRD